MKQLILNSSQTLKSGIIAVLLFGIVFTSTVYAQKAAPVKTTATPVAAIKPISREDSLNVEQLFFSALREKTIERNTEATDLFNKILQIDPSNDAAMYELANLKKIKNNYTDAQPLLEKAVTIKPDNEWYWLALADNYEKANNIEKLENVFNQLIRLNPERPEYYFDKANTYFVTAKYEEALKTYDQLEKITGPSDDLVLSRQRIYLKQGKVDQAATALEQMITHNPTQVKYYLLLAEVYNSNSLNDKALKALEQAKKVDPNNGYVHLALADIYRDKKNNEACLTELELAFAIPDLDVNQKIRIVLGYTPKFVDPDAKVSANAKASALDLSKIIATTHPSDAKALALYADMLFQNEKVKEARPYYQQSVALNNQIYEIREQLVRADLSENDFAAAIKDGEDALSYFPNQAWMNYFVGIAWQQKKDHKKAISYFKNASSLELDDKEVLSLSYSATGDSYHELNNDKSSDDAYEKALTYNADNAYTLNNYAYYLSVRGEQLEKAAKMAKHAVDLKPDVGTFEDTYAWVLFKQKKYTEAKTWMEKAIAHNKNKSAVLTEHYGDILFNTGDINGAVENWKKAKEYGGTSTVLDRKINEKKYSE